MAKIIDKPNDVFDEQINELFRHRSKDDLDLLFNIIALVINQSKMNIELLDLYRMVGLEEFSKIITLFDGSNVKFPSKKDLKDSLTLALCFYYREVEHMEWEEIRAKLPFEISPISYGIRIRNMNKNIADQVRDLFQDMED